MIVKFVLAIVLAMHLGKGICVMPPSSDSCDWIGSGSPKMVQTRAIQPIYLRCNQGNIRWHYPRGALRVVLRHGTSGRDFKACFKMTKGSSGARMFLAGKRKLLLLFQKDSPADLVRCMSSKDGHLALYVEADLLKDSLQKNIAEFSYQLKMLSKDHRKNDDCRPCVEDELIQQFCTSDFVVKGTVSELFHNHDLQRSELTVRATKVYQDKDPPLFREWSAFNTSQNFVAAHHKNAKYATVHRPLYCGTKTGQGEYLFFGRWTLGNPVLTCIPRLSEWKKVRRRALHLGTNPCQLDL